MSKSKCKYIRMGKYKNVIEYMKDIGMCQDGIDEIKQNNIRSVHGVWNYFTNDCDSHTYTFMYDVLPQQVFLECIKNYIENHILPLTSNYFQIKLKETMNYNTKINRASLIHNIVSLYDYATPMHIVENNGSSDSICSVITLYLYACCGLKNKSTNVLYVDVNFSHIDKIWSDFDLNYNNEEYKLMFPWNTIKKVVEQHMMYGVVGYNKMNMEEGCKFS